MKERLEVPVGQADTGVRNEYQNFMYFKKVHWFETGGSVGKTDHRFGFPDPTLLVGGLRIRAWGVEYRVKNASFKSYKRLKKPAPLDHCKVHILKYFPRSDQKSETRFELDLPGVEKFLPRSDHSLSDLPP